MSSIPPLTAQGSNIPRHGPASPSDPAPPSPPLPRSSRDSHGHGRSHATHAASRAATEPSLTTGIEGQGPTRPPQSTTSSGDVGTDISHSHRPPTAPALASKDRAKVARRDAGSAAAKESKDPANSRESFKDIRDQRAPANGRTTSSPHPSSSVDPLSHHIFSRTNTERSIASRLLNPTRPESPSNESSLPRPGPEIPSKPSAVQPESFNKKKGVSILSRLSMIGGSKKKDEDTLDNESELSEQRTEGANAVAFSSAVYIPRHKQPPRYIRVRTQHKKVKEFDRTFLAQELVGTRPGPLDGDTGTGESVKDDSTSGGPIWAVEFSQDGRFLATGGRDRVLRVWAVIATEEDRKAYNEEESAKTEEERLNAPVFHSKPIREFTGHEGDILDLSWSKNNFLLSSSMDKTVRLWHMSRRECLCTFKHKDFVASIAFHPRDDRFFLAGSLDSSLRLWSIPDKAVAYSSQLSDIITAVGFSPDGKTSIAGTLHGFCMFYETEGLKQLSQLHVRSSRGKNAKGSKITGIQAVNFSPENADSEVKLLVTSNDSRIRIYNMATKALEAKLKGHENACNQIRASFSDDGTYIICGSEDRKAFIWPRDATESESREKCPGEYFEAHSDIVTTAIFAPTNTRRLLQASQDPIFTLCNPPPVTLRSKEESTADLALSTYDTRSEYSAKVRKPEESPAFISRSAHHDGNIIVTTDNAGIIKVFRQDCAHVKRRHDNWETNSSFSRKHARDRLFLARAGSVMTGTSVSSRDPHSRRGSLSHPLQMGHVQISSDRINTWRHGVEGNPGRPLSISMTTTTTTTPTGSVRSPSPSKVTRTPASPSRTNPTPETRRQINSMTSPALCPTSPSTSIRSNRTNEASQGDTGTLAPPTPNFSFRSMEEDGDGSLLDAAGASYSFWSLNKWRNMSQGRNGEHTGTSPPSSFSKHGRSASGSFKPDNATPHTNGYRSVESNGPERSKRREKRSKDRKSGNNFDRLRPSPLEEQDEGDAGFLLPPADRSLTRRTGSTISRLSSELTASEDGEEMECVKCGNHNFRAKKVGGQQRLLCGKCGRMVDV